MADDGLDLQTDFDPAAVRRSALRVIALLAVILLVALLTPGLGDLRDRLGSADLGWLGVAIALEALSGFSYVLMLKPIFLRTQSWWSAQRLGWSELAMGSIMPSSGVAGLALGAWALGRAGMEPKIIARRSIAFYLIKGSANFVGVAVLGLLMFAGLGPRLSPWLTLFPAVVSIALIVGVALIPRLGPGEPAPDDAGKVRSMLTSTRRTLVRAVAEAGVILRRRQPAVYLGALGYWVFDNLVLFATFRAFGETPDITVILMAYLLGQLGGLLPVPGGVGGVDGGLVGAYVIYGQPAGAAVAAVLAYRVILFWLPLLIGSVAFLAMQRRLGQIERAHQHPLSEENDPGSSERSGLGAGPGALATGEGAGSGRAGGASAGRPRDAQALPDADAAKPRSAP